MAKGFLQRKGVDYGEIFAPVARIETIRLVVGIASMRRWSMHQLVQIVAQKGKGLCGGRERSINHRVWRQVQIFDSWPVGLPG